VHGLRGLFAAALAVGAPLSACQRVPSTAGGTRTPAAPRVDSVAGSVRVVGVDALPQVVLAPDDKSAAITLDGAPSLRRVAGLRVAVVGERTGTHLTVRRFTVLAANGVPATDGILAADRTSIVLITADGTRHPLVNPPPALRANLGHRAWVSGPLDHEVIAYGIIE
jgi:hypothetical protein